MIRHGKTNYNETGLHDTFSKAKLNKDGLKQAKNVSKYLSSLKKDDRVIILSPLERTLETARPFLVKKYKEESKIIEKKYHEIQKIYQDLRENKELGSTKKLQEYFKDPQTQKLFQINEKVYVDFRTTDIILPEYQNQVLPPHISISKPTNEKLTLEGESIDEVKARCREYIFEINKKFANKTIISVTHKDSVIFMLQTFKDFDYLTKKYEYSPLNGQINIRYRDNDREKEIDLHKPYIDNYRFRK